MFWIAVGAGLEREQGDVFGANGKETAGVGGGGHGVVELSGDERYIFFPTVAVRGYGVESAAIRA